MAVHNLAHLQSAVSTARSTTIRWRHCWQTPPNRQVSYKLLIVDGLDLKVTAEGPGHPHSKGMGGVLTGQPLNDGPYETCGGTAGFAAGPSLDQVIAERLKAGRRLASLEAAINWPTDRRDGGKAAPTNCINYSGPNQAVPMSNDPRQVWDRLFKDFSQDPAASLAGTKHKLSILDAVGDEYRQLLPRLGKSDRLKLEEHLSRIQELERSASTTPGMLGMGCSAPVAPASLGDTGAGQVGDPGSNNQYNKIHRWYAEQFAYMLQALDTAGVLSETVVLWVSEISHPNSHDQTNMPFVLATGGDALRTGRFAQYDHLPHNDLLTALANLYGVEVAKFGKVEYCNGPLSGLV